MSASKLVLHVECTQQSGDMKSNGDISIERRDSGHFVGNGLVKGTSKTGNSVDMKWSMTGTFVSSDCGNVKPAGR